MVLSYCVVNTNGREHLLACLEAIRRTHPAGIEHEILVLDNASEDGSVDAVRERDPEVRLIARTHRAGKAANDTELMREAGGQFCLLLNEDSELDPGAAAALLEELERDSRAGAAGAQLLTSAREPKACAWRLPGIGTALAGAMFLHRWATVQSRGTATRSVGWVQSSAMLVRREAAAAVGYLDPAFFVYSDETDFCKRLHEAGWRILYVPAARAVHHDQLSTDPVARTRRTVEFHRNRDLYMRKHHSRAAAAAVRALTAWFYVVRAALAPLLRGDPPRWYLLHARQALRPDRGEGLREAADRFNLMRQAPPRSSSRRSTS
ncbi:MAG TPA: glycosyltransferase family 2 protein [Solirubrobacterales bacterium]|nr:glycosyltransferase family 2 protein [Solirubrobacterales bacterium]